MQKQLQLETIQQHLHLILYQVQELKRTLLQTLQVQPQLPLSSLIQVQSLPEQAFIFRHQLYLQEYS